MGMMGARGTRWTAAELQQAIGFIRADVAQLPNRWFSGSPQFDRAGCCVTGRPYVGGSLEAALLLAGLIESFTIDDDKIVEDPDGPYLRFREVTRR